MVVRCCKSRKNCTIKVVRLLATARISWFTMIARVDMSCKKKVVQLLSIVVHNDVAVASS